MGITDKKGFGNIAEIDKNFAVASVSEGDGLVFYDTKKAPFELYGNCKSELDVFKRLPEGVAESVSKGVTRLAFHTAGIRVRFSTDSEKIAIKCVMPYVKPMAHMALTGSAGFDLFVTENGKSRYLKTFVPPVDMTDGYSSSINVGNKGMRSYEINFPLYNAVNELYIGVSEGSSIGAGEKYAYKKPVLYYGSSITQGGCASRAGNSYQSIISRRYNCDYINLGFSGNAKGEKEIAEYLATLDVSCFVCDYDYNAPTSEHLRKTHLALYKTYREKRKETPIIFVSAPVAVYSREDKKLCKKVVEDTYRYALETGDERVSYIDGHRMMSGEYSEVFTVDGCHPNDAGFLRMAKRIGRDVGMMLEKWAEKA